MIYISSGFCELKLFSWFLILTDILKNNKWTSVQDTVYINYGLLATLDFYVVTFILSTHISSLIFSQYISVQCYYGSYSRTRHLSYVCIHFPKSGSRTVCRASQILSQEAQLLHRNQTTCYVSYNFASCCTTVRKIPFCPRDAMPSPLPVIASTLCLSLVYRNGWTDRAGIFGM